MANPKVATEGPSSYFLVLMQARVNIEGMQLRPGQKVLATMSTAQRLLRLKPNGKPVCQLIGPTPDDDPASYVTMPGVDCAGFVRSCEDATTQREKQENHKDWLKNFSPKAYARQYGGQA